MSSAVVPDYQLMMPPGWVQIPLGGVEDAGTESAVDRAVATGFAKVGRDQAAPLRRTLRQELLALAADARRGGGLDLYLLVESPGELPVDAALVVTEVPAGPGGAVADPAHLLADLGGRDATASVVELRFAGPALRLETRRASRQNDPFPLPGPSIRIQYLVAVPGGGRQLLLTFTTTTAPVADALVTLFDAIAATLGFAPDSTPR